MSLLVACSVSTCLFMELFCMYFFEFRIQKVPSARALLLKLHCPSDRHLSQGLFLPATGRLSNFIECIQLWLL